MIAEALFVPESLAAKYGGNYEVAHLGVVLRVRGGQGQHVEGVAHEHVPNLKDPSGPVKPPNWDLTYSVKATPLPRSGLVSEGTRNGEPGWWLVPEKHIDSFLAAVKAAQEAAEAAEEG